MNFNSLADQQCQFALMIEKAQSITILTGAGISTESGIPDFRSPNGIWSKMEPIQYGDFVRSEEARLEDWRRRFKMNEDFLSALPNEGHKAIKRLADSGKLRRIVTQNIDGLHQKSGVPEDLVIEIHGNSTYATCLDCERAYSLDHARSHISETGAAPTCQTCGGLLKAAVISFGQSMPEDKMRQAVNDSSNCDLFIVIGSSLVVYPVASLPEIASRSGAELVILNRDATPSDSLADLVVHQEIGAFMGGIG